MKLAHARREAKRVQGDLALLNFPAPGRLATIGFEEAVDRFLVDSRTRNKPSIWIEYERLLRRHFPFEKAVRDVTRADIVGALETLKHTLSGREHAFVAIRTPMNWGVRHDLVDASPVPPLRFSATPRARELSDDELRTVWHRAEEFVDGSFSS